MAQEKNTTNTPPKAKKTGGALAKRGVLKVEFKDEKSLYNSYMPFVKGCGIFIEGSVEHNLSDEVFVFITLPEGKDKFAVSGKVVWLNPKQKLGKRVPGVGLQILGKDAEKMRASIEKILGKKVKSPLPTATM